MATALECRSAEWNVAIIDFGGTWALRGCESKKVLVEAAKTNRIFQMLIPRYLQSLLIGSCWITSLANLPYELSALEVCNNDLTY